MDAEAELPQGFRFVNISVIVQNCSSQSAQTRAGRSEEGLQRGDPDTPAPEPHRILLACPLPDPRARLHSTVVFLYAASGRPLSPETACILTSQKTQQNNKTTALPPKIQPPIIYIINLITQNPRPFKKKSRIALYII